jgi:DNA-binding response OmpR family regulator
MYHLSSPPYPEPSWGFPVTSSTQRITVIDDNAEFVDLVREFLTDFGYSVEGFQGDDLGLQDLARTDPDLVILDLRLKPGGRQLTGWEFLVLMRSHADLRSVPIIVCSADLRELESRREELQTMVGAYALPKPFGLGELERIVSDALDHPASRARRA